MGNDMSDMQRAAAVAHQKRKGLRDRIVGLHEFAALLREHAAALNEVAGLPLSSRTIGRLAKGREALREDYRALEAQLFLIGVEAEDLAAFLESIVVQAAQEDTTDSMQTTQGGSYNG